MATDPTDDDELLAEAVEWRLRIDEAPHDAALHAELDAWLAGSEARRRAYADVERLTQVAEALPPGYEATAASQAARRAPARARRTWHAAVAVAACLAFLFLPTLQLWLAADHSTGTAELRSIGLEDGSTVVLDAASAIAVRYAPARREVELLSGRAFFQVAAAVDRPFVVVADDVTVTVMGTAFDVDAAGDTVSVEVQSGTVEVRSGPVGRPETLMRGERLEIDRASGHAARSEVSVADIAAWRDRRLVVDRVPVAEVVGELGRHYHGVVIVRDAALAGRRVSGVFDLRKPVEALQAAVRTHGGSVTRITPYVLVVSGP
jgi:transmembrane sensor